MVVARQAGQAAVHQAAQVATQAATQVAHHMAQQANAQAGQAAFNAVASAQLQREMAKNYKPDKLALKYKDTQTVQNFFYRLEKYMRMLSVYDDTTRVEVASFQFDKDVAVWWRTHHDGQVMTWAEFKDVVQKRWCDENDVQRARASLRTLKQRGSAASATSEFDMLCMRVPGITDEEKRDKYMAMLKPSVRRELCLLDASAIDNYEKLAQRAIRIDEALYRFTQERSSSTPMELGNLEEDESDEEEDHQELAAMDHGRKPNGQFKPKQDQAKTGKGKKDMTRVKCYNCNEKGHIAKECKKPRRERPNGQAQSHQRD